MRAPEPNVVEQSVVELGQFSQRATIGKVLLEGAPGQH
jgi:hypothetical protein